MKESHSHLLKEEEKTHETRLEVDLDALKHNLEYYQNQLSANTKMLVMVKAFSYGVGTIEIPKFLQNKGVDYLGVAYTDEGVNLRKSGIKIPLIIMNPGEFSYGDMIDNDLEPLIFNFRSLNSFVYAIEKHKPTKPFPVHIKLDTGMHRLGFEEKHLQELCSKLNNCPYIHVASLMSHLSSSDEADDDHFTKKQLKTFENISSKINKELGREIEKHIANSAAITRFPYSHYDMVRVGIGIYGIGSTQEEDKKLQPISRFRTVISQLKQISKGESIGYTTNYIAKKDLTIAVLPLGYADGLNRHLGNGKWSIRVNGCFAPIIGNICMDVCMIDVTNIKCDEGDEAVVFDKEHSVIELANVLETIPYEVMTSISQRVKRVYF